MYEYVISCLKSDVYLICIFSIVYWFESCAKLGLHTNWFLIIMYIVCNSFVLFSKFL